MFRKSIAGIGLTLLLCILCLSCFSCGSDALGITQKQLKKQSPSRISGPLSIAERYLHQYGYLQDVRRHQRQQRRLAIRRFQHNVGLKETGKLNRRTIKKMKQPRCGYPDVEDEGQTRKKRQAPQKTYWPQETITWRPAKYSRKLSYLQQWRTFKQALQTWAKVIPRKFFYLRSRKADLTISFRRREHGDGYYNAFDGKGLKLAHAFGPGEHDISGDIHFDEDEDWHLNRVLKKDDSPNLLVVATHEFGHALGLQHSNNPKDVMSPYFDAIKTDLTESDIKAVQKIYGQKTSTEQTTSSVYNSHTVAPPNRSVKILKKLPSCSGIDAIFFDKKRILNVVSNSTLFKIRRRVEPLTYSVRIQSEFPGAPDNIAAVAHVQNRVYLFKGSYVWRYTYHSLDYGFPKYIKAHDVGEEPRAAVVTEGTRNKRVFIFGKSKFWEWSVYNDNVYRKMQYPTSRYWRSVPKNPDAAVMWKDRYMYFIKGNLYYKVSRRQRRLMEGYPKRMPPPWLSSIC